MTGNAKAEHASYPLSRPHTEERQRPQVHRSSSQEVSCFAQRCVHHPAQAMKHYA